VFCGGQGGTHEKQKEKWKGGGGKNENKWGWVGEKETTNILGWEWGVSGCFFTTGRVPRSSWVQGELLNGNRKAKKNHLTVLNKDKNNTTLVETKNRNHNKSRKKCHQGYPKKTRDPGERDQQQVVFVGWGAKQRGSPAALSPTSVGRRRSRKKE